MIDGTIVPPERGSGIGPTPVLVEGTRPPLAVSKLQGYAVFSYGE